MTGAAPVPVPPPMPQVTNTRSAPASARATSSRFSSMAWRPISGRAPAPSPRVSFLPIWILTSDFDASSACAVGVDRDELHALEMFVDHAIDGVAAAAADADDLHPGVLGVGSLRTRRSCARGSATWRMGPQTGPAETAPIRCARLAPRDRINPTLPPFRRHAIYAVYSQRPC